MTDGRLQTLLQPLASHYCKAPQAEHTEWRTPSYNRNDAMRCNATPQKGAAQSRP